MLAKAAGRIGEEHRAEAADHDVEALGVHGSHVGITSS